MVPADQDQIARIAELRELLHRANRAYYVEADPIMGDPIMGDEGMEEEKDVPMAAANKDEDEDKDVHMAEVNKDEDEDKFVSPKKKIRTPTSAANSTVTEDSLTAPHKDFEGREPADLKGLLYADKLSNGETVLTYSRTRRSSSATVRGR